MRLPIDDAVLLSLLVLFFIVQQRQRPEPYFRFWVAGWALVLCSVVARVGPHFGSPRTLSECLRVDALVCGGIAFLFSSVVSGRRRHAAIIAALLIAIPVCGGLTIIAAGWQPVGLLTLLMVLGEGISLAYAYRFSRSRGWWLLPLVGLLCIGNGAMMMAQLLKGRASDAENLVLFQIFLTAGLLLFGHKRMTAGRWVGFIGFVGWGLSHLFMSDLLPSSLLLGSLYNVWNLPKYMVAFGMILRIFAEKNAEIAGLAVRHQSLYEDYRVLYQGNPHPMWVYDGVTQRFLSVNDAALRSYGFTEQEFLNMRVSDLLVEGDGPQNEFDPETEPGTAPARHRRANGTIFDVDLTEHTIMFQATQARFVLAVDSTEREDLNRELVYQAQHDVLTGLPNRMVLEDRLMHWLARCEREATMGALLTVDIDHFKQVNDTYGHLVGDECLKITAERLRSRVRQVDTIARTGGEEFTIVVGNLRNREGAEKVCGVLLQVFEEPILLNGIALKVTISIGAAMYPDDGMNAEELRRNSDQALYEAKRTGRNRAVFASRSLTEESQRFVSRLDCRDEDVLRIA